MNCAGAESACNNACYYINCQARNDPDANKIVYTGPVSSDNDQNRRESGCRANIPQDPNPSSVSVCHAYPYSMKWIPAANQGEAEDSWDCDEWPPASHQQPPFSSKAYANSLRCMPEAENRGMGAQLGNYYTGNGNFPNRPAGAMARDDFMRVGFDLSQADTTKTQFCNTNPQPNCGSDGFQFGLTAKPNSLGKISAPIDPAGTDNHYALQNTVYANLYECSVKFTRDGDRDFRNVVLTDWKNQDIASPDCDVQGPTGQCNFVGLPKDLAVIKTGNLGSVIGFEYAPGEQNQNVNFFSWDTNTEGAGKGPGTNDGNSAPYCQVGSVSGTTQDVECYFPCFENADGQ